jgi:hypothetical protein
LVTGAILAMLCTPAFADDSSDSDWQFRLAPFYLWAVNMSGDQTIGPIPVPIELDFDDIFDSLEGVFTANFEAIHNNQWGLLVDLSYIDIKDSQGPVTVNFQNTLAEVDGLYRVANGEHNIDILRMFLLSAATAPFIRISKTIAAPRPLNTKPLSMDLCWG